jgi:alpha-N-arabinofuranosidase
MGWSLTRRDAVKALAAGVSGMALLAPNAARAAVAAHRELRIDVAPKFELSPYLFLQFMEPLGVTDGSVEAAWDHERDDWRADVVAVTRELGPTMLRWGGIFTDFYRWREGVGPRERRRPMINAMWGGLESNQVGTAEFVDFARKVHAEPLMCVNFESDGRTRYKTIKGEIRTGDAREAADWVAYCNNPDNSERRSHGLAAPIPIRFWQLGNETSYDRQGFDLKTAIGKTVEFAKAMRGEDPNIQIIAWGDSGWAKEMQDVAGEYINMLAFHHMFNPDSRDKPVLQGELYRRDADATWNQLMEAWKIHDAKIREVRDSLDGRKPPLAMTECHFVIPGRDRCDVMSTWATGVAYGRVLNNHQRHGDVLKIATAADFCGTRWQVNAVMIPVPHGKAYLMPVARVMKLYRHHIGSHAVEVTACPDGLDAVASRTDRKLFLHVVNTDRSRGRVAELRLTDGAIGTATGYQIVDEPMVEVSELNSSQVMQTKQLALPTDGKWSFPAASVTVVEIELAA